MMWQRYEFNLRNSLVLSFLVYGKSESCLLALSFHLQDLLPQALSQEYLHLSLSLRRGKRLGLQHHVLVSCRNIMSYAMVVLSNSKICYFLCKIVMKFAFKGLECPFKGFGCTSESFECASKAFERRITRGS